MNTILTARVDEDDDPPGLSRRSLGGRREADRDPELPRMPSWRELTAIGALVTMAYTIGFNWREITTLRTDYDKHVSQNTDDHHMFVLREVSDTQYREIQRQLAEINRLLEKADRQR